MAGACTCSAHVIFRSAYLYKIEVSKKINRVEASFTRRISAKINGVFACGNQNPSSKFVFSEGSSCIFVGPLETASRETLESLYHQARNSYYSGKPLIVDDMFDKVEMRLRWYGSKSVIKYPRCSIRRQSTYADAEEDPSQLLALASVWALLLIFGISAFLVPAIHAVVHGYQDVVNSRLYLSNKSSLEYLSILNDILFLGLGSAVGYPIASASVHALKDLRTDLVALKGPCPNCGEEVFAFVRTDRSTQTPLRTGCHVCESSLQFRTKVEKSNSRHGGRWVYGRIYLVPHKDAKR